MVQLILTLESRLIGLMEVEPRHLIFQFCEKNKIPYPFNMEAQMAGDDWVRLFLTRHKELSIRTPEAVSNSRAMGCNNVKTDLFFNQLRKVVLYDDGN